MPVVVSAVVLADVLPVQQHLALGGVVEAAQQLDQGGLARAVPAHHRQLLAGADGEVHVGQGVLRPAGVAEGHIPQFQLIEVVFLDGQGLAVPEPEGLGRVRHLPEDGQLQALPVELPQAGENARHPLGKAADGGKVQHKFRRGQIPPEGHGDEQAIGRAVARQGQPHVQQVGPQAVPLALGVEVLVQPGVLVVQLGEPRADAEDADVLCQVGVPAADDHVVPLVDELSLLLPVAVAPAPDAFPGEIAGGGAGRAQPRHPRPHLGEQQQVDHKADHVGGQAGHGLPDGLPGVAVAVQAAGRFFQPLDVIRVLRVGEGGAAEAQVQVQAQPGAHSDPPKKGVRVQVSLHGPDGRHPQGEPEDQPA